MKERKREKEKERKQDRDLCPWQGAEDEEKVLHLGKHLHWWGDQLGRRGDLEAKGEPSSQCVAGRIEWDLHNWSMPQSCMPQPETGIHQWARTEHWNMGSGEQIWGGNCGWLSADNLTGWKGGAWQPRMLVEETWTAIESKHHCWVTCKGLGPLADSLPLVSSPREAPLWSWNQLVYSHHHLFCLPHLMGCIPTTNPAPFPCRQLNSLISP